MKKKNNWLVLGFMALYLTFFGFISILHAAEAEKEDFSIQAKKVTGEVSMIRKSAISVVTDVDKETKAETEMVFLLNDDVEFARKALKELREGDIVEVSFDEYTQTTDEGEEEFVKRVTKKITFLRPASNSLRSEG